MRASSFGFVCSTMARDPAMPAATRRQPRNPAHAHTGVRVAYAGKRKGPGVRLRSCLNPLDSARQASRSWRGEPLSRADRLADARRTSWSEKSGLAAFVDLEDLVRDQPMGFAMDRVGRFSVGSLHQTEDLACALVDPIALVVDAVGALGGDVGLVRLRHVSG